MCAGTTMTVLPGDQSPPASFSHVHAGHDGLAGARARRPAGTADAGWDSIAPKTASSWWANGRSGRVAITAERDPRDRPAASTAPTPRRSPARCHHCRRRRAPCTSPDVSPTHEHLEQPAGRGPHDALEPRAHPVTATTITSSPSTRSRSSLAMSTQIHPSPHTCLRHSGELSLPHIGHTHPKRARSRERRGQAGPGFPTAGRGQRGTLAFRVGNAAPPYAGVRDRLLGAFAIRLR